MWDYFTPRSNTEAACNICGKSYGTKGGSTSTLKKHLGVHKLEFKEYSLKQAKRDKASSPFKNKMKATVSGEGSSNDDKGAWNQNKALKEKQQVFDDAIVDWFSQTGTPFFAVGTPAFKNVIKVANIKLVVKTPQTVLYVNM